MSESTGDRLPVVRDDLRALAGYHSPQLEVAVRLNTNEAPVPPPAAFREALAERVSSVEWNRYPDRRSSALSAAIAAHEGVAPESIFVANGSNEVIQTVCLAYGGYGRTALTFEPTYAMHGQIARTVQTAVVEVERDPSFAVDGELLAAAMTAHDPSVTFLCSPNNPTGTPESQGTILEALEHTSGLVLVDEAYGQFASFSAVEMLGANTPLVVTRTFSKTWSMAAARLGYLIGPPEVVEDLYNVVLPYHLDAVKQAAGLVALEFASDMEERISDIVSERERMASLLTKLGVEVFRSEANFVLFRTTPTGCSGGDVWQRLVDQSVLVRDCSSWHRLDDCLRVTVGTTSENDLFLDALGVAVQYSTFQSEQVGNTL